MPKSGLEEKKGALVVSTALTLLAAVLLGASAGIFMEQGSRPGFLATLGLIILLPFAAYLVFRMILLPSYRRLEDTNLELHLKQEELLDVKDDLFIKFLGIYDVNYSANSPQLFPARLKEVADTTARVMDADACFIFLYNRKTDDLELTATNSIQTQAVGRVRIPLGSGIEGWVGRKLEPVMLKEMAADPRYQGVAGLSYAGYHSVYCLPLYVYSNGALMGVMEVLYEKAKTFTDEEINFFTTLTGILSTTIQNEQMQTELRKMNNELEQWVDEKTEELRASEERYRTLVENACESIFVLAENGDVVFANEQAVRLTGYAKYDLLHKNLFDLFADPARPREVLNVMRDGQRVVKYGELVQIDGTQVPVDLSAVALSLMGKRFVQTVVRDISSYARLEQLLIDKEQEIRELKSKLGSK